MTPPPSAKSGITGRFRTLVAEARAGLSESPELLLIAAVAAAALVFNQHHLGSLVSRLTAPLLTGLPAELAAGWRQLAIKTGRGVVLIVLPLASLLLLRIRPTELGLSSGRPRRWLVDTALLYGLMLPVLLLAARLPQIQRAYPSFVLARHGPAYLALGLGTRLFYMLSWEFLFRGYLLFGFSRRVGPTAGIAVATLPFVLMHFGKPPVEAWGSIVAGLALGVIALRGRSFLPAALLHFAVAATLDILTL